MSNFAPSQDECPIRQVVSCFGGMKKMALVLGHRSHTTVYGWIRARRIPSWREAEILEAARRDDIAIPPGLFDRIFPKNRNSEQAA